MEKNNLFVKCDCESEGIEVTYEKNEGHPKEFWFSFYMWGRSGYKLSLRRRLKYIWMILSGKDLYGDMVILDEERTKELVEFLDKKLSE